MPFFRIEMETELQRNAVIGAAPATLRIETEPNLWESQNVQRRWKGWQMADVCCMEYGLNYFVRFGTAARPDSATMPRFIKLPRTSRATTKIDSIDNPYNSSSITLH